MAIVRSIPREKLVGGRVVRTSEVVVISEDTYSTNGESLILVKDVDFCKIKLNCITILFLFFHILFLKLSSYHSTNSSMFRAIT